MNGYFKKLSAFLALFLALGFGISCVRPGSMQQKLNADPDEVALRLWNNREALHSFTASGYVSVRSPEANVRLDIALAWVKDTGARLDLLSPFFTPLVAMVYKKGELKILDHRVGRIQEASPDYLRTLIGMDVNTDILFELLSGLPKLPQKGFIVIPASEKKKNRKISWFFVKDPGYSLSWRIGFDATVGILTRADLCNNEKIGSDDKRDVVLSMRTFNPEVIGNVVIPKRIHLQDGGETRSLNIVYETIEPNVTVDERIFSLD